ncbi:alpha/beta hydrolase [Ulvibacterium sp.]|uniref:alpha/beta hydrolase n=1 Tax=Ulvibacterium sp. TaxID=2665914 RepID=UPI003BAD1A6D
MLKKYSIFAIVFVSYSISCLAQKKVLYKQIDTVRLFIEIHAPENVMARDKHPALVFFFGGGWKGGDRYHFLNHARYFSQRGLVCFLVDYRTEGQHGTTPFEALKDAKSSIRFIRKKAPEFGIDASKIIAAGGSAGGHLAAATALIEDFNDETDDMSISCVPNALALFNPVVDNGPGGYGHERIGLAYKDFSPLHNIQKGAPPTLFFLGTNDKLIPVATAQYYQTVMENVGSSCTLKLYEGEGHGFFNYRNRDLYKETVLEMDHFLQSLGYLEQNPVIEID